MAISNASRTEETLTPEHIFAGLNSRVRALATRLRGLFRKTVPDAIEKAYPGWYGIGYRHPTCGYYCVTFPQAKSVRLLFAYGVLLADSDCLLRGKGEQGRYMEMRLQMDTRVQPIKRLIGAAVSYRKN